MTKSISQLLTDLPVVEPAPSSQATQKDVTTTGAIASELKASMLCDEAGMLLARVRTGEREETLRHAETIIRHIAALCADFDLDLIEVLPTETCSQCERPAVEHRTYNGRRLCVLCIDERIAKRLASRPPEPLTRTACLDRARELVSSTREATYGAPAIAFRRIAALWSTALATPIAPHQVAICMMLLKVARLAENPEHADSWVDAAGYAACGAEVAR